MAANFPNLKKEPDIQIQEAQRVPKTTNQNRHTQRQIKMKMAKVKGEDSKGSKRKIKRVNYKGTPLRLSADFSTETLSRKGGARYSQSSKRENMRILYPARLSFTIVGERESFSDLN